jgi:hypothetical protein
MTVERHRRKDAAGSKAPRASIATMRAIAAACTKWWLPPGKLRSFSWSGPLAGPVRRDLAQYDMAFVEPVTIKCYANRRLYNPAAGAYVTLEDLALMLEDDEDFVVSDAKTGADITRSVLKQIILKRAHHG